MIGLTTNATELRLCFEGMRAFAFLSNLQLDRCSMYRTLRFGRHASENPV